MYEGNEIACCQYIELPGNQSKVIISLTKCKYLDSDLLNEYRHPQWVLMPIKTQKSVSLRLAKDKLNQGLTTTKHFFSLHTVTFVTIADWLLRVRPLKNTKILKCSSRTGRCIPSFLNRWLAWPCKYDILVKPSGHSTSTLKSAGGELVSC